MVNVTYITLDGYVEMNKYRYLYFVILFMAYILIICFNATIVCIIVNHKNLHEPMYIFIAALLLNSVLFSTVIYPKLLIDIASERQIISYPACIFQFQMFYSLGGSEFLLLLAMSFDRYVSICKPLQYPTVMTKTTVSIFLLSAWILPSSQVAVSYVLNAHKKLCSFTSEGIFCNNTIDKLQCVHTEAETIHTMTILLNIAILPVLFILSTYTRILIIAYRSSGEVRKKAAQTCLPHLIVLISYSCLCAYDIFIVQLQPDFPKIVNLIMTLQIVIYQPLLNPLIYGLKMKEISKHLKRLFVGVTVN